MPFAAAQIGLGFRNEISPRQGLLRVREFTMAEIEHFVDPLDKTHPKFASVAHLKLPLYSKTVQEEGKKDLITDMTLAEAIAEGVLMNETIAYFMARSYQFLTMCGINHEAIRYR